MRRHASSACMKALRLPGHHNKYKFVGLSCGCRHSCRIFQTLIFGFPASQGDNVTAANKTEGRTGKASSPLNLQKLLMRRCMKVNYIF